MKKFPPTIIAVFCLSLFVNAQAQSAPEPNPVIITTYEYERLPSGDTSFKNYSTDTLIAYYVDKGIRPNNLIVNHRILIHGWGADSYKIIFVYEIDKFENINKATRKTTELIDASFKNEADKKIFWKRWNLLFDRHDDSIMSDWGKPKM